MSSCNILAAHCRQLCSLQHQALSFSFGICLNSSKELLRPQIAQVFCDFAQLKHSACETHVANLSASLPLMVRKWPSVNALLIASILVPSLELPRISTLSLSRVFIIYLHCGIDSLQLSTRSFDLRCFQRWCPPDIQKSLTLRVAWSAFRNRSRSCFDLVWRFRRGLAVFQNLTE